MWVSFNAHAFPLACFVRVLFYCPMLHHYMIYTCQCIHTHSLSLSLSRSLTHTHTHKHTHTHTHTHTHVHAQTFICNFNIVLPLDAHDNILFSFLFHFLNGQGRTLELNRNELTANDNYNANIKGLSSSLTIECVLLLQNVFSFYRMCSLTIECVLLLQNVFSYYRMCSLTTECVLWQFSLALSLQRQSLYNGNIKDLSDLVVKITDAIEHKVPIECVLLL